MNRLSTRKSLAFTTIQREENLYSMNSMHFKLRQTVVQIFMYCYVKSYDGGVNDGWLEHTVCNEIT
jgi:hypothetical protein